ncbi:hypothetical protein H112_04969 [Trichophyton rubrum D6]|uniref:Uncharacterized protein n=2 Tax=Trichophyton rubrum TaxID=5551 RepID=F2SKM0_TRIRC|nr:uncharacterized protein TERG_02739 [Trichophyton rubrum CBS 118892]EZF22050.1 hypothetical protein H100_04991 [Trichophyton rubrum MR850]EZF41093.1 hypothetical protein H102_04978 [Trichophyton rubrum CBS 100081]EZF51784.1 hypothetical protein H103_04980 [Trichophyton rubrum CBS 288.86]EZF62354.1 hypothetical protein H104_04972 [Trichophyton rubrum CBS 289.86]EZF83687.1 hypothetical protein H110_04978 [Trichophyton rubrum MR1448]EZF94369.1 hypothetical protein H113_05022 [Trichophyton rubr
MAETACQKPAGPPSSPILCTPADFVPVWARSHVKYAQNLLELSDEPVEYDDDEDYNDNCFFFPEDCVYNPPPDLASNPDASVADETDSDSDSLLLQDDLNGADDTDDAMAPALPEIKMLDTTALSDLLSDNLSPPEITSIFIFASNGAVFAHASPLPQRRIRNLCATYGAAYKSYAVKAPNGNLTGVSASIHPSAFSSTPSIPLGNVGSIMFEMQDMVAVVTKIADKVLLAVVGPTRIVEEQPASRTTQQGGDLTGRARMIAGSAASDSERTVKAAGDSSFSTLTALENPKAEHVSSKLASSAPNPASSLSSLTSPTPPSDEQIEQAEIRQDEDIIHQALRAQWAIDRSHDLDRLAGLNLASSPHILLALESKSAALGKFLGNKLADLESPEDF